MSKLILIRHGQASANSTDYDQLSTLGYQQAAMLGKHWVQVEQPLDRVYVGSLRRHHQTLTGVAEVYQEHQRPWPVPQELPAFDEYDAVQLLQQAVPQLIATDDALRQRLEQATAGGASMFAGPLFWELFVKVTRMWARGELNVEDVPSWSDFQAGVAQGIAQIQQEAQSGETIAVFTSGGPIAVAVGLSFGLAPIAALELSWRIYNASLTHFLCTSDRLSLSQFNTIPHLLSPANQTYR